ncbi:MAG: S-layer homology domain-containing protein, partial [Clostridia bacterium]|nr:S-layer homology domain-containing protein [Clostridia bacterium]
DTNILSFEDYDDISKYAIPAIQWGTGFNVINNEGTFIEPQHKVTRAEAAELLYNYVTSSLNRRGDREVTEE